MKFTLYKTQDKLCFQSYRITLNRDDFTFSANKKNSQYINCNLTGCKVSREVLTDDETFIKYKSCIDDLKNEIQDYDKSQFTKITGFIYYSGYKQIPSNFKAITKKR